MLASSAKEGRMRYLAALVLVLGLGSASMLLAEERGLKQVLDDSLAADAWIYDDLEAGFKEAGKTGKPLLLAFVCVP